MARVGLVTVLVHDYDVGIEFFSRCLGFRLLEDTSLGDDKRWVVLAPPGDDSTGILLARPGNEMQRAQVGRQAGGRVAFFLYSDDFEADHRHMTEAGVRFIEHPRHEPYGTVAVFEDCSGNQWDLIQLNP